LKDVIEGKALVLGDNIDTDAIIPGQYLTSWDPKELGLHALEGVDPELPRIIKDEGYTIIVAGRNFGCGSSREHAVLALKGAGIKAVIAESFARIFYRNAINRGLPAIEAPNASKVISNGNTLRVSLEEGIVEVLETRSRLTFKPFPNHILQILGCGGLINYLKLRLTKLSK